MYRPGQRCQAGLSCVQYRTLAWKCTHVLPVENYTTSSMVQVFYYFSVTPLALEGDVLHSV